MSWGLRKLPSGCCTLYFIKNGKINSVLGARPGSNFVGPVAGDFLEFTQMPDIWKPTKGCICENCKNGGKKWLLVPNNYSWIGRPIRADKKSTCQRTRGATTLSRPPLESSRRGEPRSAVHIFLWSFFDLLFFKTSQSMAPTKICTADLDSPRRIL